MNAAGPAFAILSAATWGAGDFVGGLASRANGLRATLLLTQLFGTLFALSLLPLAAEPAAPADAIAWAVAAGLSGLAGVGCLYLALSRGTMGLVAPLTGLVGAVIPALVGVANGDPVGPLLLVGMVVALAAIVVISLPDPRVGRSPVPTYHGSRLREWMLIMGSGLGFAGFYLGIDHAHAAGAGTVSTLVAARAASMVVVVAFVALSTLVASAPAFVHRRRLLALTVLAAIGDTGGNVLFIVANAIGSLSTTVVLGSLYPVSTAVLARIVLHERLSGMRLAGVALAVTGAVFVSAGSLRT